MSLRYPFARPGAGLAAVCCCLLLAAACGDEDEPTADGQAQNNCVGSCKGPNNGTATNNGAANNGSPGHDFGPKDPGDWTSFRNGPYRTGVAEGATVGPNVEVVWQREEHLITDYGAAKPSGAVWDDMLFWPSDHGTMYAFDRMTGEELWSTPLINGGNGIHSTPAVTKSTVMVGTYRGYLHALDRVTGEEIWNYKIGNVIGSSPVYVHAHEAVYVSHESPRMEPLAGGGYVTKNDPWTGEAIWVSEKIEHWPHASVAVDVERKVVLVGANDGIFHAYDTDTGDEIWQRDFEPGGEFDPPTADIKTTAAVSASRGVAIFGTWDDNVYALDVMTGEDAWVYPAGGNVMGSVALDDEGGRVFAPIGGRANRLCALDLDSGEELWCYADGGGTISSPALSGDRSVVVFGANDGKLHAVNAETGEQIWAFETDGVQVTASPVLVGDMIYIAGKLGSLYGLRTF